MEFTATYSKEEEEKLPLLLVNASTGHLQEPVRRPNGISSYQLIYCIGGAGEVFLGSRRGIVREGQGMFLTADTPHAYHAAGKKWRVDYITFSGSLCAPILNSLGLTDSDIFSFSEPEVLRRHILNFKRIYRSDLRHKNRLFSKELYSLLVDVSLIMNRMETEPVEDTGDVIMRIIDYMELNYRKDISLDDIADHIGLSKEHICRLFKRSMNETVIEDLTKIRIFHAARMLLQEPDKTALEIGMECGFPSPSYCSKEFKKLHGMTPNMYRLKNGR